MMSETVIQTAGCSACGAEIRDGSMFCYGCGTPVAEVPVANDAMRVAESAAQSDSEVVALPGSRPPLRSAASLRKQRRAFNRQPVEVTWEPRTGSPVSFVIATVVVVIGALVFLILALYLR
ncbi:MAG TPA: zinc ribbon domain-containing protein [Pyrinomonadaceae bacterium]|nr:zinc ribbon domain-containing protein [Pyrinomonadaceae bacterium]